MEGSTFSLRQVAAVYCRFVMAHSARIGGLDRYQLALFAVILTFLCGVAFLSNEQARPNVSRLVPPGLYCLFLILALFLIRLPTFLAGQLNPDEGMLLAGAMKLRQHPVFWRSLDGTSSGPLNYYPLTLLNVLGLPLDYATARLMNVVCVGGAIAILYPIARLFMRDWAARLIPLPALGAAMAFRSPDFLHYSSECVSSLLLAVATWLLLADVSRERSPAREMGIGALAALIPLAKLQAAPMAVLIPCAAVAYSFFRRRGDKWRKACYVAAGFGAVLAVFAGSVVVFHMFDAFWQSYIVNNLSYANSAAAAPLEKLLQYFFLIADVMWYEQGILGFFLCALGLSLYLGWRAADAGKGWERLRSPLSFLDLFAFLLLATGVYAVHRPDRFFQHYFVFLIFPLGLIGVVGLIHAFEAAARMRAPAPATDVWPGLLFVLVALALPGIFRGRETMAGFNSERWMTTYEADSECPSCQVAGYFARPGTEMAVWGWEPSLYVLTRTIPATSDTFTQWQIQANPLQGYYRRRFLEELKRNPPQAFLDAVGPGRFGFQDRKLYGYEAFPALRQYINSNFYLVGDIDGVRVFAPIGTSGPVSAPFRMNSGGGALLDEAGNGWKADAYFSGGQSRQFQPGAVDGKLPAPYQSERVCTSECRYLIPIQNGNYLVRMFFAERDYTGANQRLFDVAVDNDALSVDMDIFRAAGGAGKAHVLEQRTTVSNGLLDISLLPKRREAEINAIEVLPSPEAAPAKFQFKSVEASQVGPPAEGVTWEADPGWTLRNRHDRLSSVMWRNTGSRETLKGLLTSSPLPPSSSGCLVAPVMHDSSVSNLSVALFDVPSGQRIGAIPLNAERGRQFYEIHYDPAATVRLVAGDRGGGWLGLGELRLCK